MPVNQEERRSLMEKLRAEQASDPGFARSHKTVQWFMAAWAAVVALDRLIGVATNAYGSDQMAFALVGGSLLILVAFWGTRGHIQGAMMVMQINLAVFIIQFACTCFLYRDSTAVWSTLFYGIGAGVLLVCSLMLFLNRDLEDYRLRIRQLKGKEARQPRFYRTNTRLLRNKRP